MPTVKMTKLQYEAVARVLQTGLDAGLPCGDDRSDPDYKHYKSLWDAAERVLNNLKRGM